MTKVTTHEYRVNNAEGDTLFVRLFETVSGLFSVEGWDGSFLSPFRDRETACKAYWSYCADVAPDRIERVKRFAD